MDENMDESKKAAAVEAAEAIAQAAAEEKELPETPAGSDPLAEAQQALAEAEAKAAEYKDKWMRAVAEFENYKKRNADIRRTSFNDGMKEVILKVLPVGDTLDRALAMPMDEKTKEGVAMVARRFDETLSGMGLETVAPASGDAFDPTLHDAIMQVEPEEGDKSGSVKDVFVKGYKLDGRVVRYAQVRVVK